MSFLNKLRAGIFRFMQGRHGPDQLALAMLWTSLGLNLLAVLFSAVSWLSTLLSLLGFVLLVLCFYRILSRNDAARGAENRKYLSWVYPMRTRLKQARVRFENRKTYTYFSCPGCKCRMRLPKSVHGVVRVTCKSCGRVFEKKL